MRKGRPLVMGVVTMIIAVILAATGCGAPGVNIDFTRSEQNAVIVYQRKPALPTIYPVEVPDLVIYGNGTAFRITPTGIKRGSFTYEELRRLLSSIVDSGFFKLPKKGENPPLGGDTDNVSVILKEKYRTVSAGAVTATSPFRDIVEGLRNLKIPKEQDYTPDNILLYASVYQGAPPAGSKILDWNLDPQLLKSASQAQGPAAVSGTDAQAVWNELKKAYLSTGEVYWRAGDTIYARVVGIPQFPKPGV